MYLRPQTWEILKVQQTHRENAPRSARVLQERSRGLGRLRRILKPWRKVVLAFSGGVDSTFLLSVLCDDTARQVLAVTARSQTYPQSQAEEARRLARLFPNVRHREIETDELSLAGFRNNPPDRCYLCKKQLFSALEEIRQEEGFDVVLDGSNLDDLGDYRPGRRALQELGARSPLLEAGLGKKAIRRLSRARGLPTWNKPSFACLSSRFPYGTPITEEALARLDRCEAFLCRKFHGPIRVRFHGAVARIELDPSLFPACLKSRRSIVSYFRKQGFSYVTLDLAGYRTGSMNEVLPQARKGSAAESSEARGKEKTRGQA